ncbi:MAG TPA: YqiA/YcfP family alpha/beta fold hydrolase [Noviherbaspirillum sp.]|uniref:YqiA/YcfP family alpha/beta fold hydrolase n=1 Tax=Noviherbaspirillum sp. TaxID=1926288 RepID=UPI002D5D88FC|nr:YqiA/YcfP family alpha/beta fold hydrolase [Noviherbaspirillum sp.]HYD95626.1 YqiA/YcfP family alpha/beta fold hydrolase [Noviherbaspirillum sp.]
MILYLHGFRSSPLSFKARMIEARMAALGRGGEYQCPQLSASPREAIALAERLAGSVPAERLTLIGSSLGGFYATWLAERLGCRAVLLNPAVDPARDLDKHVGAATTFHSGEPFEFKREYVGELQALAVERITRPERYLLLAATGDEVLDWREMVARYPGAQQCIIEGSDHGISDFDKYLDRVLAFCGIDTGAAA